MAVERADVVVAFLIGIVIGGTLMLANVDEEFLQTLRELETTAQPADPSIMPLFVILVPLVALFGFVALVFMAVRRYRTGEWFEQERGDGSE